MYFDILPSIQYDTKPISYPFSESDFVVAKNFFKRFKVSDTGFSYSTYYTKSAVPDGERLDQIAEKLYGSPYYDWVIVLTNNLINPSFGLPMSESELRKHVEEQYDNPYYDIHHYEIISEEEQISKFGKVLMPAGTWVDQSFYEGQERYIPDTLPQLTPTVDYIPIVNSYIFSASSPDNNLIDFNYGPVGVYFDSYGSGTGADGFVFYPALTSGVRSSGYLHFRSGSEGGGSGDARYFKTVPMDCREYNMLSIYAQFGNDQNGGEFPDVIGNNGEGLFIGFKTDPDSNSFFSLGSIIPVKMIQGLTVESDPVSPGVIGGIFYPGRRAGIYLDVPVYRGAEIDTGARVDIIVDYQGEIYYLDIVDRGESVSAGVATYELSVYVKNEDIGNGYVYASEAFAQNDVRTPIPDLELTADFRWDENRIQRGRFDSEPFTFSLAIPEQARTATTEWLIYQPSNTGPDNYGFQSITFSGTTSVERPLDYEVVQVESDYYIIDNVTWVNVEGTWKRKIETGFQYLDNGTVKEISGSQLARPVTQFEYESNENEKNREIFLLKPQYIDKFVDEFRKASKYKKSSDYINAKLKKTGV